MSYDYEEFRRANQTRRNRWGKSCSIATPDLPMPNALKWCRFAMTRVDGNQKTFPVDVWGNEVDPKIYGTVSFQEASSFWREGQNSCFDGYSMVLPDKPAPIYISEIGEEMFIAVGVYENCVTITGKNVKFSNEFLADWISLGEPTHCFLPSRTGICWIGLSPQPIMGGIKGDKQIDSANFIVPITDFFINDSDEVSDTWNSPPIKLLPPNAQQIVNKILA